jgi:hypothetical protein
MTLYLIHDADGRINQANKVFITDRELKVYDTLLGDLGQTYVKVKRAKRLVSPDHWYVASGKQRRRPLMPAVAQATTIAAGTDAVITGIPKGAAIDIQAAGTTIYSVAALDGDELEFQIPVVCTYRVVIRLWPYQDCVIDIEAVA